jgi:hypothetical protein
MASISMTNSGLTKPATIMRVVEGGVLGNCRSRDAFPGRHPHRRSPSLRSPGFGDSVHGTGYPCLFLSNSRDASAPFS